MQAKSGAAGTAPAAPSTTNPAAPAAPATVVVAGAPPNSQPKAAQPLASKPKKPPLPQWRKKDKALEQGVFYKVKDGEYHRVKNDLKKDEKKAGNVTIDMKAAANKMDEADGHDSRFAKWAAPLFEYFQNIQTIYVLLSVVGVVILLIVILCLIPFSNSKKRDTAYLPDVSNKSLNSHLAHGHSSTPRNHYRSTSSKLMSTVVRNFPTTLFVINNLNQSPKPASSNPSFTLPSTHTTQTSTTSNHQFSSPLEPVLETTTSNEEPLLTEEDQEEPTTTTTTEQAEPQCQPLKYLETSETGVKSLFEESFSCDKSAPFIPSMPQFVSIDRSVAFGYPISQLIICNNAITLLTCPAGQLIHIYSAYYGVQSDTVTACVTVSSSTPALCFSNYTLNRLNAMCEAKQSCSILVTSSNFGEPCLGFNKQMVLQYQCVDEPALSALSECSTSAMFPPICPQLVSPSTQNQQIWCEPSTMLIECGAGQVISILCAFYGKDPNYHCPGAFYSPSEPTYCYSHSSEQKIRDQCTGKRTCQLTGDPDFVFGSGFINPCPGFAKILFIQWECVSGAVGLHDSQSKLSANQQWSITGKKSTTETHEKLDYCDYSQEEIECSSTSPYVPHFLSNSTQTSFGYPIHQQIICNTGRIILLCPNDLVLHIHGAYYGIQSPTTENSCIQSRRDIEVPAMSFFPSSLDKVVSRCENNSSCLIEINRVTFGDPCPSFTKQFFVQYQCIERGELVRIQTTCGGHESSSIDDMSYVCPTPFSPTDHQERTWCPHDPVMSIRCSEGRTIEILCAFYGLNQNILNVCAITNAHNAPVCYFHSSFEIVKAACQERTECQLGNFKHTFTDPCKGFEKALYVRWRCV